MVIVAAMLASLLVPPAAQDAARAPLTTRDLVEVAEIMGPVLAPDGKRVAFRVARPSVEANDTRLDWYVSDIDDGTRLHVGSAGTAQYDGAGALAEQRLVWDADSEGFRFLASVEGASAIWHWRRGAEPVREIADPADILDIAVSDDGGSLRYSTGATRAAVAAAETKAYEEGVLVDHSVDLGQPLAGGKIEGGRRVMQRWNGNWFDRAPMLWNAPRKVTVVAVDEAAKGGGAAPAFTPAPVRQGRTIDLHDGGSVAITGSGTATRVVLTGANGDRTECNAAPCRSPALVAIGTRFGQRELLLFERAGGGRETVSLWRIGDGAARVFATTDGAVRTPVRHDRCAIAAEALVCAESRPLSPPRLMRIDFRTGERTVLADPNAELRRRVAATEAIAVPLHWANGHDGILLKPRRTAEPMPLVVQYYRCDGFLKGGVGEEIPMLPLVAHGIGILCINGKPAPQGGGDMQANYSFALAAIETAIDGLADARAIDPKRVGIGGLSFGSTVAMWAIRKSKRFAAATISSGQITPHYYWANALPGRDFAKRFGDAWRMGDPVNDPDRWRLVSPTWDIAALDTPLLMQVPESEVRNLIEWHTKLKLAGKPAELVAFADEIHLKYQPVHKRAVYERNFDWYRFWLKGEEDADPAKSAQYRRWRSYRAEQLLPASAR